MSWVSSSNILKIFRRDFGGPTRRCILHQRLVGERWRSYCLGLFSRIQPTVRQILIITYQKNWQILVKQYGIGKEPSTGNQAVQEPARSYSNANRMKPNRLHIINVYFVSFRGVPIMIFAHSKYFSRTENQIPQRNQLEWIEFWRTWFAKAQQELQVISRRSAGFYCC